MGHAENMVEQYLVNQAKKCGFLCYKWTSPGQRGVPDRILIGGGKTIFIETKSKDGRLSKIQEIVQKQMHDCGADVRTLASRDAIDAVLQELNDSISNNKNNQ